MSVDTRKAAESDTGRLTRSATLGFVYFVQHGRSGPIKIGYARDPMMRLADLQVASPYALTLLGAYPGTIADEQALHRRFADQRMRGEWFRSSRELKHEIAKARAHWAERVVALAQAEYEQMKALYRARHPQLQRSEDI